MADLNAFAQKLMDDEDFRKKFAKSPHEILKAEGVELPEGSLPDTIDEESLEERINEVRLAVGRLNQRYGHKARAFDLLVGSGGFGRQAGGRGRIDPGSVAGHVIGTII